MIRSFWGGFLNLINFTWSDLGALVTRMWLLRHPSYPPPKQYTKTKWHTNSFVQKHLRWAKNMHFFIYMSCQGHYRLIVYYITLPEINSPPLKGTPPSKDMNHRPTINFQVRAVSGREGALPRTSWRTMCYLLYGKKNESWVTVGKKSRENYALSQKLQFSLC